MNAKDWWECFTKTGRIGDYLHYACTCEEENRGISASDKEAVTGGNTGESDRSRSVGHADWGL
ncbi:MAG: hypothetical protein PUB10_03370 [Clostridiales bacterium]|nr:hypothetical protein [Clostridiales bacterium]